MLLDLLFLSHNRRAFTSKSLDLLIKNTDWTKVRRLYLYDDSSTDGSDLVLNEAKARLFLFVNASLEVEVIRGRFEGPVAIMVDYLKRTEREPADWFGKIDSDTCVPFAWLEACLEVVAKHPELDLLGIEAMHDRAAGPYSYEASSHIGGIGLMRRSAFRSYPEPRSTFFGFTHWQNQNEQVVRGFITPALPVCLLDRVPIEPWRSLATGYVEKGWARAWGPYNERDSDLWDWIGERSDWSL
jgi:hypothetical protein